MIDKSTLARGLRAFADALEEPDLPDLLSSSAAPAVGSPESMRVILDAVRVINDESKRGVTRQEMREIATNAGINPRGTAGYYSDRVRPLLETREDGRWITPHGRERLQRLDANGS
jgi:hypothetical protein